MIEVTRLNQQKLMLNCLHILGVEATPDTLVTLTTGEKLLVRDSVQEVVAATVAYLRRLGLGPAAAAAAVDGRPPSPAPGP